MKALMVKRSKPILKAGDIVPFACHEGKIKKRSQQGKSYCA